MRKKTAENDRRNENNSVKWQLTTLSGVLTTSLIIVLET